MNTEELKPCECGSKVDVSQDYCKNNCRSLHIWCDVCNVSWGYEHYEYDDEGFSGKFSAQDKLIKAWNKRI